MKAIHDRYYASPPADYLDYRWRLQVLAEERLGSAVRAQAEEEDAAYRTAVRASGG